MGMVMVFMAMVMTVIFMVVVMLMDMLTGFMIMSMIVIMSLQINIHALLFLPMDRHFHMCSCDSAFYHWLRLDGESRQAHLVHGL